MVFSNNNRTSNGGVNFRNEVGNILILMSNRKNYEFDSENTNSYYVYKNNDRNMSFNN